MILTATALAGISSFASSTLSSYFAKKALDAYFVDETNFKDELREIIEDAVQEYAEKYPQASGRNLPFYHSVNVIDQLLKFRVMKPEEYNIQELLDVLKAEPDVTPPTEQNLKDFFHIFMAKVNVSDNLKKLEIKDTYGQEIFSVSRRIDNIQSQIENLAKNYTGDLELQWRDRVETYVKTIQAFKLSTALTLLESLEKSLEMSTTRPGNNFMAFLEYQKGICYGFLQRNDEAFKSQINAWNIDKTQKLYAQRAVISFFRLNEYRQALQLCEDIIKIDYFNSTAWAIRILCNPVEEFEDQLNAVPETVKNDLSFKMVLYNTSNNDQNPFFKLIHEHGQVPACKEYKETPVNVDNFNSAIFWINICTREIYNDFYFDFMNISQVQASEISVLNKMLTEFNKVIKDTEISGTYRQLEFLYAFTNHTLLKDAKYALEMEAIFNKYIKGDYILRIYTANALQLSGFTDRAIMLLEDPEIKNTELLLLLVYCYQSINDRDNYLEAVKRFLASITALHPQYLLMYLNVLVELKLRGETGNFKIEDFLEEKTFDDTNLEILVTSFAKLIFNGADEKLVTTLTEIANTTDDPLLVDLIGSAFFSVDSFDSAMPLLGKNLKAEIGGRELYQYMHAKSNIGKDYQELLALLKNWREKFDFNTGFLRLEAKMRRDLLEWGEIIKICEYYLPVNPKDESMLALYIGALNMDNTPESIEKIKEVSCKLSEVEFTFEDNLISICNILITHNKAIEAFELMYPHASNPERIGLRTAYFGMCLRISNDTAIDRPLKEFNEAREGMFIKYERDGNLSFTELTETGRNHPLHSQFFGKKTGDTVTVKRAMVNVEDTIVIRRIMNKYLSLHDQILNQVDTDPYSGLPFTSFKFNPDQPGSFMETLQSLLGERGLITDRTKDADYRDYYSGKLSLSELALKIYDANIIDAYYSLIRFHDGIYTVPQYHFRNQGIEGKQFVLDYSSLIFFYQLNQRHQTAFPEKFIISKYIVEHLRTELRNIQYNIKEGYSAATIDYGRKAVAPAFDFTKNRSEHLKGLLDWINNNCIVELSARTLEFINGADLNVGENHIIDAAMSTTLLVEDEDERILITDDFFYFRLNFLKIDCMTSSENYLKRLLDANDNALDDFLANRYIGFSTSSRQLNYEYAKYLAGQSSNYLLSLKNLLITNSTGNLETAFEHIKEIALNPVITAEKMEQDVVTVFVNLLKNAVPAVLEVVRRKTFHDFRLLGTKQDYIINAFHASGEIITAAKRS